ncbi:erythromycin esterase family protein [Streptomyces sp. NPDC059970]|uniref:erythromycin esterase family protein n=1 Tax=Streptomyces sp. NPDC059970 TaxID=3347019 RepID=UPI00367F06EC
MLAAHKAHIQKSPISFNGHLTGLPMGQHLHRVLGDEYFALGLTSITGHTADMRRDENTCFGFTIDNTPLEPPEPGSIEAAFGDAESGLNIADLRQARQGARGNAGLASGPDRIRIQGAYMHTPVIEAFDAILNSPTSTVADDLEFT